MIDALTNTPTEEFFARRQELWDAEQHAGVTVDEVNDALEARPDLPRPLLPIERETLLALLRHEDFPGRDAFVAQVDLATLVGYCPCPCATLALEIATGAPPGAKGARFTAPTYANVIDPEGYNIGTLLVTATDGVLTQLHASSGRARSPRWSGFSSSEDSI